MKNNFNTLIEKIGSKLKELIKDKNPQSQDDVNDLCYPKVKNKHFKSIRTKKYWWVELKSLLVFVVLAGFAAFVFYRCVKPFIEQEITTRRLLLLFGLFAIVFVGLVAVAWFLIKSSVKHHKEQDERENKLLVFRQKMLESAFELENREVIAEKHCLEKALLLKEKEFMYLLDEKQREEDHKRKVLLKRYEIVEEYMKHVVDFAKNGQNYIGVIDLQQIFRLINKEEQPASKNTGANDDTVADEENPDKDSKNNTPEQPTASAVTEKEPALEDVDPATVDAEPKVEPTPETVDPATVVVEPKAEPIPEEVDPNHVEEHSEAEPPYTEANPNEGQSDNQDTEIV